MRLLGGRSWSERDYCFSGWLISWCTLQDHKKRVANRVKSVPLCADTSFFPKTPYNILKASLKHLARTRDTAVWAQIRAKMSHMCTIRSFPKLEKQQLDVSRYYNTLLKIQKIFLWVDPENQRCWATSPNWSKNALFMPWFVLFMSKIFFFQYLTLINLMSLRYPNSQQNH